MSKKTNQKGTMAKDTIIYMLAKGIEGIVGIVTMSVMTYLFLTEQMGYYSTVNIAITTIAMIAVQWLVQSVLRYINKYDIENRHKEFYSTVFSAWLVVNIVVVIIALGLMFILKNYLSSFDIIKRFTSVYSYKVIITGILWFVTYNTAQLIIAMLAAVREARLNLLLSMITVCGRLIFMVLFCKLYGSRIEFIFLSYFITDLIVSVIGMIRLKIYKYLNFKNASKDILKELKDYGMPLMGNQLATSVLNKSDIYIVTIIIGAGAAGIYQTNYSLIATAFTLLNASVMRGCYPTILRAWSEGDKVQTKKLIGDAVRFYLLVAVPAVFGVAAVNDILASALFESQYVEHHFLGFYGNSVMFWVALGMMFLGLTEYSIKHWELNANTKAIFLRSLIGGVVNVGLNLVLIKLTGNYFIAAITTFVGFFVYFILAKFGTRKYLGWNVKKIVYFRILFSALIMYIVIIALKSILSYNKISLAILIICGIIVYGVTLFLTGEVKNEVKLIMNKVIGNK
ncbi:MAG: lipopolysaccharide biosynthesis protein [Lachnospirales bacterium]